MQRALDAGAQTAEKAAKEAYYCTRCADLKSMPRVLQHALQLRKFELPLVPRLASLAAELRFSMPLHSSCMPVLQSCKTKVLIGVSNGAIPAVELAQQLDASAVWLASGCSAGNVEAVQTLGCPTVLTVASEESFFGGEAAVVAAAAAFAPEVQSMTTQMSRDSWCHTCLLCWGNEKNS